MPDVARVRLNNALRLFDEFVQATVRSADAATLRGLERRFAERLLVQPSYWSQIKAGSRQIGERLARQFEQQCKKPVGWLDLPAPPNTTADAARITPEPAGSGPGFPRGSSNAAPASAGPDGQPLDDDERFIVGLVLTYYRRHPARARQRLLELLGEVLQSPAPGLGATAPAARKQAAPASRGPATTATTASAPTPAAAEEAHALWLRAQAGVAPLKRKP